MFMHWPVITSNPWSWSMNIVCCHSRRAVVWWLKIIILIITTFYFYPLPTALTLWSVEYQVIAVSHVNAHPQSVGPTLKLLLKFTRFFGCYLICILCCRHLVTMFGDYQCNNSPTAIFTPPRSRDQRKNSSAAMFTTRRNHSYGLTENQVIVREQILSGKSCLKLLIVNCIFVSIQVFSRSLLCLKC